MFAIEIGRAKAARLSTSATRRLCVAILCCASITVVSGTAVSRADDDPPVLLDERSDLSDLIRYADRHSPAVEAARREYTARLEQVPQQRALPDPTLTAAVAVVPIETRVGPQYGRLSMAQTIPSGAKRTARAGVAASAAETAARTLAEERERIALAVANAYYELYFLTRAVEITRSNRDVLILVEQSLRKAYEAGKGSYADLIRSQVEIGKLENELRSRTDRRRAAHETLNHVLHRPSRAALPQPRVSGSRLTLLPEGELHRRLLESSPRLGVLDAMLVRDESRAQLAAVEGRPDWTVSLSYFPTGTAEIPGTPDSGRDPWIAGVSMSVPLWKQKYRAARREARERQQATVRRQEGVADELRAALTRSLYEFRNADREIGLYRDTLLPKAEQSFEASQAAVRTGSADVLALVDAQRVLLEFQLAAEQAVSDRARALAGLRYLLGGDVLEPSVADGLPGGAS
jgi:outer membrane protein TolC